MECHCAVGHMVQGITPQCGVHTEPDTPCCDTFKTNRNAPIVLKPALTYHLIQTSVVGVKRHLHETSQTNRSFFRDLDCGLCLASLTWNANKWV